MIVVGGASASAPTATGTPDLDALDERRLGNSSSVDGEADKAIALFALCVRAC